jgi:hypothetical protein
MKGMLIFLKHVRVCELRELLAWLVVGKRELGLTLGKWEVRGLILVGGH